MKSEKYISPAVIRRLPRYYRYLGDLLAKDITRISSGELSKRMGITASQIRQDLNNFGGFGQQGYGYNVEYLYKEMGKILGLYKSYSVTIIGAGNLGQALANYTNFEKRGFRIEALFDVNPQLIGLNIRGSEVLDMAILEGYLRDHAIDIAVLTIPKTSAVEVANLLVDNGISAIWNFASVDLKFPGHSVVVENVHLSDSLMTLSYQLKELRSETPLEE